MSKIKILQLLSQSIESEIPVPGIFQYLDYSSDSHVIIDPEKEKKALRFLRKKFPNSTQIKIQLSQLNKFDLIHELIVVLHSKRFLILQYLEKFKELHEELIWFLQVHERYKTLSIISDLDNPENPTIEWESYKLEYVKMILIDLLNNRICFPEIIFGINLDRTNSRFEIALNQMMIQALKLKGFFKSGSKWSEMTDRKLILGSLKLIILENIDISKEMFEHVSALYEKNYIGDIPEQLKRLIDSQFRDFDSIQQIQCRDKIKQLLIHFYVSYSLKVKIPIPQIITSIVINRRQTQRISSSISISTNSNLLESINSNPQFKEINKVLKLESFVNIRREITQQDFNNIKNKFNEFGVSRQSSQQQLLDMIELVFKNKEKLQSALRKLQGDEKYKKLIDQYQNVNYVQIISPYYYKFIEYVFKIDQYLNSQEQDFIIDLDDQSDIIEPTMYNKTQKQAYVIGKNLQKLYKILVLLKQPYPEILKNVLIRKTKTGSVGQIYLKKGLWFMPYVVKTQGIYRIIRKIIEQVKGTTQIDDAQIIKAFTEETLPDILLGFDLSQFSIKEVVFYLIILFEHDFRQYKQELKPILQAQLMNDLEEVIKQTKASNMKIIARQALNSLQNIKKNLFED